MRKTQFPAIPSASSFLSRTYTCRTFPPYRRVRSRDCEHVRQQEHFHTSIFLTFTLILTLCHYHHHHHHHDMLMVITCTLGVIDFAEMREDAHSLVSPHTSRKTSLSLSVCYYNEKNFAARGSREVVQDIQDVPREADRENLSQNFNLLARGSKFSGLEGLPTTVVQRVTRLPISRVTAATHRSLGTPCIRVIRWSTRQHLRTLWIYNLLNTVLFLLSIVIVEQSVHIKYTKSTQRQKRLVSSRKIAYKIFALSTPTLSQFFSPFLSPYFFFISLLLHPLGEQKSLLLIFGTENAIVYPSLRRRERDARAR